MSRTVLITGGRLYKDFVTIFDTLDRLHYEYPFSLLVNGDADGTDKISTRWARSRFVPHRLYPIDIAPISYGNRRGNRRNFIMLEDSNPDAVIAFPGGSGTRHMIDLAESRSIPVIEIS
jgi:hypothetical protein